MYNTNFTSYLKSHRASFSVYDGSITAVKRGKYVGTVTQTHVERARCFEGHC